ncbi:PSP1 domain-containing protein [Maridesulfovibrio bastinii]|uniref:PSP1 domain-containing protein n=1 Tax=Maridesulfovibrio bastinii TaxID=47157 RepID=UPI00040454B4|nr:regulatory iron-sulfur-containing complex subunit RicT [Maridesulfovibrio bastinii]
MSQVLGVKFNDFGQIYYFSSGPFVVREGQDVIVKTEQGMGMGKVFLIQQDLPPEISEDSVKTIYRLANDEDVLAAQENQDLSRDAFRFCRECIDQQDLDMKLVDVEVFFDRSKMVFYFTAPGRIDFRELVKDLVREYRTRIELRQIGVRHETQMLGAIGNCGQLCCCRRFMRKFMPVTIRMAKEQNLFLNPTKISGICGRLLCCLSFEQDNYEDFHKKSPKIGKKHNTVHGRVRVARTNFFRGTVTVAPEHGDEIEISLDEWPDQLLQDGEEVPQPQAKPARSSRPQRPSKNSAGRKSGRDRGKTEDSDDVLRGQEVSSENGSADAVARNEAKNTQSQRPEKRKKNYKPRQSESQESGSSESSQDKKNARPNDDSEKKTDRKAAPKNKGRISRRKKRRKPPLNKKK